jgi:hypothetical protein
MKAASVQEIKTELKQLSKEQLITICLRLARFKKENKELLDYLLFQAHDLHGYVESIKQEMDESFEQVNTSSIFLAKKTIRKILRNANKYIRYTNDSTATAEILLHFLKRFVAINLPWKKTKVLRNIYESQMKKLRGAIDDLHEDLQYDFRRQVDELK